VPPGTRSDILGVEFSGTIAEFGEGCSVGWKVGDEVFGLVKGVSFVTLPTPLIHAYDAVFERIQGAYAEYIQVSELMISPKPSHLSFVEAAGILENWLTGEQSHPLAYLPH
jgi:NADPH:quinone reductase-like Zn-dependent oxidoreductase